MATALAYARFQAVKIEFRPDIAEGMVSGPTG
jgi:hypothetical protein